MPNSDLIPSLLSKINENQLALEAAIMELTNWVEQQGGTEIADNVRDVLDSCSTSCWEQFVTASSIRSPHLKELKSHEGSTQPYPPGYP